MEVRKKRRERKKKERKNSETKGCPGKYTFVVKKERKCQLESNKMTILHFTW